MFGSGNNKAEKYYLKAIKSKGSRSFEYYRKSAELGHTASMVYLGRHYIESSSPDDIAQGIDLLKKATDNSVEAITILANFYIDNIPQYGSESAISWSIRAKEVGILNPLETLANLLFKQHDPNCVECYSILALASDSHSCFVLGQIYTQGVFGSRSDEDAFEWYLKGALMNHIDCIVQVAKCYYFGIGVGVDITNALTWFLKGSQLENAECMYYSALIRLSDSASYPNTLNENLDLLRKASDQQFIDADFLLGSTLVSFHDHEDEGIYYLNRAVQNGCVDAAIKLGNYYFYKDSTKATSYYKIAAEFNVLEACYKLSLLCLNKNLDITFDYALEGYSLGCKECSLPLAYCYLLSLGVERDDAKAIEFIDEAEKLDFDVTFLKGVCNFRGINIRQNYREAFRLFNMTSIDFGKKDFYLGICYLMGYGTIRDLNKAEYYFYNDEKFSSELDFYRKWIVGSGFASKDIKASEPISYYFFGIAGYRGDIRKRFDYDYSWIQKAAQLGCIEAISALGSYHFYDYRSPSRKEKSRCYFNQVVMKCDRSELGKIGYALYVLDDFENAVICYDEYYLYLEEIGCSDPYKMIKIPYGIIALNYYEGKFISKSTTKALKWAQRGIKHRDLISHYIIAICHFEGNGVKQSYSKSREYFEKVVEKKLVYKEEQRAYIESHRMLAHMYEQGIGGNQSYYDAARMYQMLSCFDNSYKEQLSRCISKGHLLPDGVYKEKLKTGGTLVITKHVWNIVYYVPGPNRKTAPVPDLRYNGHNDYVHGSDIDGYIEAWKVNLQTYFDMMSNPSRGLHITMGLKKMTINASNNGGVSLSPDSRFKIRTHDQLNELLKDYEYAKKKASEIQSIIVEDMRPPTFGYNQGLEFKL